MIPYLQFQNVSKRYAEVAAIEEVSLSATRGSVTALLGPNGAGKSTLFGCLLGLTRPTNGTILYHGNPIPASLRRRIGYMPERIGLYPQSSVLENAMFFARLKALPGDEVSNQLERVGLYGVRDRAAGKLSKGMLQRLGLSIALAGQPEILVLDEPFNGLDPALLETLQAILAEERARGATLLISTHTMSAVEPLATHAAILLAGKLAAHDSVEGLRARAGELSLEGVYHSIACQRNLFVEEVAA